jgi:hypothetical protein
MEKIVVDDTLKTKLFKLERPIEFCDGEGNLLGFFLPSASDQAIYEEGDVPITDEEIALLLRQPLGRPLADILADLEKQQ